MPITKATASSIAPAAKGDLVVGSATNDASVLAVGSANQVLTVDSSTTTGLKWAAPAAGGKVLQVVQDVSTTNESTGSSSYVDTNLSQAITPSSTSSKILAIVVAPCQVQKVGADAEITGTVNLVRTSTQLAESRMYIKSGNTTSAFNASVMTIVYLDSPNTTSSTTYKVQFKTTNDIYLTNGVATASLTLIEIGA